MDVPGWLRLRGGVVFGLRVVFLFLLVLRARLRGRRGSALPTPRAGRVSKSQMHFSKGRARSRPHAVVAPMTTVGCINATVDRGLTAVPARRGFAGATVCRKDDFVNCFICLTNAMHLARA